ncbi:MAG: hypothetical protein V4616_12180 [Bacteroidota bacterium]
MKTTDPYKDHINRYRAQLDEYGFDAAAGWNRLEQQLPVKKNSKAVFRSLMRIAAVCTALAGIGIAYFTGLQNGRSELAESLQTALPADFIQARDYYAMQVNAKMGFLDHNRADSREIAEELNELQKEYAKLEKEMQKPVNKQDIINAMIDNYKLRLALLESFIEETNGDHHETEHTI